jgi:hypothetical protein
MTTYLIQISVLKQNKININFGRSQVRSEHRYLSEVERNGFVTNGDIHIEFTVHVHFSVRAKPVRLIERQRKSINVATLKLPRCARQYT